MADIIRAGALWGYCQLTQFMAYDAAPLLAEAGLSRSDLDNPDAYLPRPKVVSLLELTAERLECPDFGLRLAEVQDIHVLGALAFAIRNAPDLRSSIAIAARHVHYQAPEATLRVEKIEDGGGERIVFNDARPRDQGRQMTEHAIGLFCRITKHLTDNQAQPTRVTFAHGPGCPLAEYATHLVSKLEFSAPANAVYMDRRDLALPLGAANPHLKALVESYLDLYAPSQRTETERRAHAALTQIMRSGPASIEDVADMMRMHPRTLQRRLTASGTTFGGVRDNVRKRMAELYLANSVIPLADVAYLLGYANQSAMARSCMRWFGKTPMAKRQELLRKRHTD